MYPAWSVIHSHKSRVFSASTKNCSCPKKQNVEKKELSLEAASIGYHWGKKW